MGDFFDVSALGVLAPEFALADSRVGYDSAWWVLLGEGGFFLRVWVRGQGDI